MTLNSIDLRGNTNEGDLGYSDAHVPRSEIRRFVAALKTHGHPPLSMQMARSCSCQLNYLALHNNFLDRSEMPLLFDALPCIPFLENFVLFNHDVGDVGVDLLMHTLMGVNQSNTNNKSFESDLTLENEEGGNSDLIEIEHKTWGLKELYLSHCNISCKGASSIAKALDHASSSLMHSGNKLKNLQVLSLGSNRIEEKGVQYLAKAFGRYPSLHRLVLHGNKGFGSSSPSLIRDSKVDGSQKIPIFIHALLPLGWQGPSVEIPACSDSTQTNPTNLAMTVFAPLILSHIQRRWEKDLVLIRPHDLLRQKLRHEMYKHNSTFVDSHLQVMPDVMSWIGRNGACCRQTSLHSQSLNLKGRVICHSSGREQCGACATIHLNDLYELLVRMPHLIALFQSISDTVWKTKEVDWCSL